MGGQFQQLLVDVSQQVAATAAVMETIIREIETLRAEVKLLRDKATAQEVNAKWDGKEDRRREKQSISGNNTAAALRLEFKKASDAAHRAEEAVSVLENMLKDRDDAEAEAARLASARRWAVFKMFLKVAIPLLGSALTWLVIRWANG